MNCDIYNNQQIQNKIWSDIDVFILRVAYIASIFIRIVINKYWAESNAIEYTKLGKAYIFNHTTINKTIPSPSPFAPAHFRAIGTYSESPTSECCPETCLLLRYYQRQLIPHRCVGDQSAAAGLHRWINYPAIWGCSFGSSVRNPLSHIVGSNISFGYFKP